MRTHWIAVAVIVSSIFGLPRGAVAAALTFDVRSAGSGAWSDPATWDNNRPPRAGDVVQVRPGHVVTYDVNSDATIRLIHVAGTLRCARDRSTRLDVGQVRIQRGEHLHDDGFDCDGHGPGAEATEGADVGDGAAPVLEIGTADEPNPRRGHRDDPAGLRAGHGPGRNPAIINCGGRWDVHGAPMSRTWVKLGRPAQGGGRRGHARRTGHRLENGRPR